MANLDSKTDGDFRDVRAEVGRLMGKWLGASIDPAVVIAALLSNSSALAMMRTFGKRGQARDMVQEMTDAAFEDADAMLREMGMTELLSRSDDLSQARARRRGGEGGASLQGEGG